MSTYAEMSDAAPHHPSYYGAYTLADVEKYHALMEKRAAEYRALQADRPHSAIDIDTLLAMHALTDPYAAYTSSRDGLGKDIACRRAARDAILDLAQELDEAGWVCVPREATAQMWLAADPFVDRHYTDFRTAWSYAIEGAPPPTREA